jgi:hypothetical protein
MVELPLEVTGTVELPALVLLLGLTPVMMGWEPVLMGVTAFWFKMGGSPCLGAAAWEPAARARMAMVEAVKYMLDEMKRLNGSDEACLNERRSGL